MDAEIYRAQGGRPPHPSPDSEMAQGGSIGGWPMVRDEAGYAAGSSGLTAAG